MAQLMAVLKACLLMSLAALPVNTYSSSIQKNRSFSLDERFQLPAWILKDAVLDQLSWQGLPMKIEFFRVPSMKKDFFIEIASLIPEGAVMSKTQDGYQINWSKNRHSYLLLVEEKEPSNTFDTKGIFSSIALHRDSDDESSHLNNCLMRWLPDDVQLIFSLGDMQGGVNKARIDGYSSALGFSEARSMIAMRLKKFGWVSLAENMHRSDLGPSATFEAFCGNLHARIGLQKQTSQTRISVMSIVQ